MCRLICTFVVHIWHETHFLMGRLNYLKRQTLDLPYSNASKWCQKILNSVNPDQTDLAEAVLSGFALCSYLSVPVPWTLTIFRWRKVFVFFYRENIKKNKQQTMKDIIKLHFWNRCHATKQWFVAEKKKTCMFSTNRLFLVAALCYNKELISARYWKWAAS